MLSPIITVDAFPTSLLSLYQSLLVPFDTVSGKAHGSEALNESVWVSLSYLKEILGSFFKGVHPSVVESSSSVEYASI